MYVEKELHMTPEQQGLLDKALRSLQAARGLNETGFAELRPLVLTMQCSMLQRFRRRRTVFPGILLSLLTSFVDRRVSVEFYRYLITAEQIRLRADYNIVKFNKQGCRPADSPCRGISRICPTTA